MGLTVVSPEAVRTSMHKLHELELEWTSDHNIAAGSSFEMRCFPFRNISDWKFAHFEMEKADIEWRWKFEPTGGDKQQNKEGVLFRAKLFYGARIGEKFKIKMRVKGSVFAGVDLHLAVYLKNGAELRKMSFEEMESELDCTCTVPLMAGPVDRFSVISNPVPDVNGKVRTCLVPEDRQGNPAVFEQWVKVEVVWNGTKQSLEMKELTILYLDQPQHPLQRATIQIDKMGLSMNENISNGISNGSAWAEITGNPVVAQGIDGKIPAFGEIHWHTDFSGDGQSRIEDAIQRARDTLNLNFVAPSDHNPTLEEWEETVKALEQYHDEVHMTTLFGWENSTNEGHENYYFVDPNHELVCNGKAGFRSGKPHAIIDQLEQYDKFIGVPHHTNAIAETRRPSDDVPYWHPYNWTTPASYIRLVEIMQCRGNQERNEYPDDSWRGWHQYNGGSVQDALDLGYKIGFTGGTDNHVSWPGRGFTREGTGYHPVNSVILTGVWMEGRSRQNLYDALWNRHTWAVWDTRAIVRFSVQGQLMGSEIQVQPGEELTAHMVIHADDSFKSVEIISEKETVWSASFEEHSIDETVQLGTCNRSTHYYLRAMLRNGGIIYASPVFVNCD